MDFHLSVAARTLWQEARSEPLDGQRAVAHAIVNRRNSGRWGNTFAEVCLSEFKGIHQFSGWNRSDPNRVVSEHLLDTDPALVALAALINAAESEPDPTGGATHYFAPKAVSHTPDWVVGDPANGTPSATACGQFGHQLFFKNVK